MQIYLSGCCLYDFDQQKVFGARYMAKIPSEGQEHSKQSEINVEYRGNMATKRYQEAGLPVGSHG